MRISLAWLRDFVDLPESPEQLRAILDDLGLVVEGIERVGEGLEDVVVARVEQIAPIPGADRIRRVVVDAGAGPLEIVCGAWNFDEGDLVALAPVGAVLPGGFAIARRTMRGVTSHGMLCSGRELGLSEDHGGLLVLNDQPGAEPGRRLTEVLGLVPDVVFEVSVEGNRPDAWCVEGVARDLAVRLERELRAPRLASPNATTPTASLVGARIEAPDLCLRLTVSVLRRVTIAPSPAWVVERLRACGMRPISNVVDASNLVMLELGQPTHPYDLARVAGAALGARRARPGETLTTLDGVERHLATPGRGLGDTGEDCVIVDGEDHVLGLAGIMGGAASEITEGTTEVLIEAACFDPMAIARSTKRHGLRTEASARFERGVDPTLALRAVARLVAVLEESSPGLEWLAEPLDLAGELPATPTITLAAIDVAGLLGTTIEPDEVRRLLSGLDFVVEGDDPFIVRPPARRLDVRAGLEGRADLIEEVARLHGYGRLVRRVPAWPEVGGLSERQRTRRRLRDAAVALGALEVWTPTLVASSEHGLVELGPPVTVANPLSAEESVLRATCVTGVARVWLRNLERGRGDVALFEVGTVFTHPEVATHPRRTRGGVGGRSEVDLPEEGERLTLVLGRPGDDAVAATVVARALLGRLALENVVVRALSDAPPGLHPTRAAALVDRASGARLGVVGEVDPHLVARLAGGEAPRRAGVVELDLDALADPARATPAPRTIRLPSRFPSAVIDLAFVTPDGLNAQDLAHALGATDERVESVTLFDVYRGGAVPSGARSLAFTLRLSSPERTLDEREVAQLREALIEAGRALGASLR
ncbi:MAG TPA: phenylalanine--tRNA ligase subunit beta [Acidimicrobiales bacterium]|nr:phenylalanine--tRNA ligase subunit beta [Acidimicrobiales bacterium]